MDNPDREVGELSLLDEEERERILVQFNATDSDYPREKVVHQLFEEQVERSPEKVAIVYEGKELNYRELNRRANQLARQLREKHQIRAEERVGLLTERSLEMMVGIVGILKAGGAYVPLDPNNPPERVRYMMEDAGIKVVLGQGALPKDLPRGVNWVDLDDPLNYAEEGENLDAACAPGNLVYVIYTSGSTGRPKGVMVENRSLMNLCTWHANLMEIDVNTRMTRLVGFGFDASVLETFPYLLAGATIYMLPLGLEYDIEGINRFFDQNSINVALLPTRLCQLMLDLDNRSLRTLLTGGEELSKRGGTGKHSYSVIDNYGPTEATVVSTYKRFYPGEKEASIGKPISNSYVYILDDVGEPVPVGVRGEIYVGGEGVARGYINQPELTAERFVKNPFRKGERMYRTGDLGRWRKDGNIEFFGRIDHQVKIRGYRIELGEVENALLQQQGVKEAVVVVREREDGDKCLCAYVVPLEGNELEEIQRQLAQVLPSYMVPNHWTRMDELPLTLNGKVDRQALPAAEIGTPGVAGHYVAPRTPTEETLAEIWKEVLKVEKVGVLDNFFQLGGHSLLAIRVASRISQVFTVEIPLRDLFEKPTIEELGREIDGQCGRKVSKVFVPIQKRFERDEESELSYAQERLWFLDQFDPGSNAYHVPCALRFKGALKWEVLQNSLRQVVKNHEVLRTVIKEKQGRPVQVILPEFELKMDMEDIEAINAEETEIKAKTRLQEELRLPFDLTQGPLIRAKLLKLREQEHVLLLVMHHIICDGWSSGLLWHEVQRYYQAEIDGIDPRIDTLPIQYADYAAWQKKCVDSESEGELEYWRKKLGGDLPVLELPADHARPAIKSYRGDWQPFKISKDLSRKLTKLSQKEETTLYILFLAAFRILLYRYTGQEDILIGSPVAGRSRPEVERLIGFFVNTLVLRTQVNKKGTVRDHLKSERETALEAYGNQEIPFEKLVRELQPHRDMGRSPLFQVMFTLQTEESDRLPLPGVQVEQESLEWKTSKFDLMLGISVQRDSLEGGFEYATDLFERETVEMLAKHFEKLLKDIVDNPDREVGELSLLDEEERERILVQFNATDSDYPREKVVHQLFEEQVERSPEKVAIVYEGKELNYRELNRRANQLARQLREKHQIRAEERVGLLTERSLEMMVGIVGILKAGGAYVPLDPNNPPERVRYMMEDAGIKVVLGQGALPKDLPRGVNWVDLDDPLNYAEEGENLDAACAPGNLVYVIYTSGSTGRPKGVMVENRNVVRLIMGTSYATLDADRCMLQMAPLAFDASTFEIWGALLHGGKLILYPGATPEIALLSDLIKRSHVNTAWLTSAFYNIIIDSDLTVLKDLSQLLIGGEVLSKNHVRRGLELMPLTDIINGYGPTEGTTFTTCYSIPRNISMESSISIGKPISNSYVYILDDVGEPVPVGVRGEIYVGGEGVARGYINQPELTAERFVKNPFRKGERMYRTGDLGRWRKDGNIEFFGRIDHQVKIRGYRIELGEVENALLQQQGVKEAVVVVREREDGDKCLCAYVVPLEGNELEEIQRQLAQVLPSYMVPNHWTRMDELPLTLNGKVDRQALPAAEIGTPGVAGHYVAPRTPTEETLAEIWKEVLKVEKVGVLDNFFQLGGHSLLAIRVASRISQVFTVEIPLRDLFEKPTIEELGRNLEHIISREIDELSEEEAKYLLDKCMPR